MAAIAPMGATLPERLPGPWVGERSEKAESSYALFVLRSPEDASPAPAAAVLPTSVPTLIHPAWAKNPRYMKTGRVHAMKIAKVALDYYNKKMKIKFELLDFGPSIHVPSKTFPYMHINFTARSSKEGSQENLFFAELQLCSRRKIPSGYSVLYCEPLGSDSAAGRGGMDNPRGTSTESKNVDSDYCYACGPFMFHPKGTKYVAGHCTVPHIYEAAML